LDLWHGDWFFLLRHIFPKRLNRFFRFSLSNSYSWSFILFNITFFLVLFFMKLCIFWTMILSTHKFPIDPNRKFLDIHSLIKIIINHVSNNSSNRLIIMFLDKFQPLTNNIIKDIIGIRIIALMTGHKYSRL
jgi:hypothetical protein